MEEEKNKIADKNKEDVKEKNETLKSDNKKAETKKKSKKGLIIAISIIVILVLIGASIGGYFLYKKIQLEKPLDVAWGQTYYTYLKSIAEDESKKETYGFNNSTNTKIEFCDIEIEEEPVMVISYEKDTEDYSNIYYIKDDGTVHEIMYDSPTDFEMLYSIEEKEYNWYVVSKEENEAEYTPIQNEVIKSEEKEVEEDTLFKEYTIKEEDKTTVETVDGDEISIDKFDETFVKPDIEDTSIDFDFNLIEEKLKEAIENLVNNYKNKDQIITDEVKEAVTEKETEITNKQEEIEKAKDELEKKKAEEEAKRKAEEEAKKGFKVGNHRLKYGTYKSDVYIMDSSMYGTITLNQDGTFHIKANCEGDYPYKTMDCDGTYKATRAIDSYEYYDAIEFTTEEGDRFVFSVSSDNEFSDQWHGYSYQG